jgi:AAA domain
MRDFNDLLREGSPGTVRAAIDGARAYRNGVHHEIPHGFSCDGSFSATPQPQLIKKTIPQRGTGLGIGQSGAGKTVVFIDMSCALASGTAFFGREIPHRGGVAYLAPEGGGGIANRFMAAKIKRGISEALPFVYTTKTGNLTNRSDFAAMIQKLKQINLWFQQHFGVPLRLTFIDTMSAAFEIKDENDNAEIVSVCKQLQQIDEETGAFVLGIHHAGKNQEAGARGGSAWRGNVDNALTCIADRVESTGECRNRRLILSKYRDGAEGAIGSYDLQFIELGEDEDGEPFAAPAIDFTGHLPGGSKSLTNRPRKSQQIFDAAFNEALLSRTIKHRVMNDGPMVDAVDVQNVRQEFFKRYGTGEADRQKRAHKTKVAFGRLLKDLAGHYGIEANHDIELIWRL